MSNERVALKIKIGIKGSDWPVKQERGHALYPDFNQLEAVKTSGMDWSRYVDIYGEQWHYDKTCGHKDNRHDSPQGMQWGMLLVPPDFAQEAVDMFPEVCFKITESECEEFWDNYAHAHEQEELIDDIVVNGINAKKAMGKTLTSQQEKALDPNDPTKGIVKNHKRYWKDYKEKKYLVIV